MGSSRELLRQSGLAETRLARNDVDPRASEATGRSKFGFQTGDLGMAIHERSRRLPAAGRPVADRSNGECLERG
jgi:hypothetical protein